MCRQWAHSAFDASLLLPTVVVVFHHEDAGQVPQGRHVEGLKHLALQTTGRARGRRQHPASVAQPGTGSMQ